MISIDSAETLFHKISEIQHVSPTLQGRTSDQVEWKTLSHFLAAHNHDLPYPFDIRKSEKPDFLLEFSELRWGIEITEAIHPDYNRLRALLEQESPDWWFIDPSHFKWGAPRKSLAEIRALASQTELTGLPWMGNDVEKEFAAMLKEVVNGKATKLGSGKYEICDKNVLLIYSNQSFPKLNLEEGASLAKEMLGWAGEVFDVVSVVRGDTIIEFFEGQALVKLIPKIGDE